MPVDYLMLVAAAFTAYFLRFASGFAELRPAISVIPYGWYLILSFSVPAAWILIFALNGLYKLEERKFFDDIPKIIFACSTGTMLLIALIFFRREFFASRFVILAVWVLSMIFVIAGRSVMSFVGYVLRSRGIGSVKTCLIGKGRTAEILKNELVSNRIFGRKISGIFTEFNEPTKKELQNLKNRGLLDEIIFAGEPDKKTHESLRIFCEEQRINFKYSADSFSQSTKNFSMSAIAGIPLVEIRRTQLDGWSRIYKRIFDIIGSVILIILSSPIMVLVALAIKLERGARGPVLWSRLDDGSPAKRVGEDGKLFHYFKFRSMKKNTHNMRYKELSELNTRAGTPMVKIKNDPRVTRVGTFIRHCSLDELPEFFLVLKGDMSLVGPRPHLPEEVENYKNNYKKVFSIKPGITGLAQISGRADLDFEEEIKLDNYYIENWSLWMDLYILLKTPFVMLSKKGAY